MSVVQLVINQNWMFKRNTLIVGLSLFFASSSMSASEAKQPESNSSLLDIYSVSTWSKIASVNAKSKYNVVSKDGERTRIQFLSPTVPGWVSRDYVTETAGISTAFATVNADVLNFRLRPSIDSQRITQVYRGYQSPILAQTSKFVQILAPSSLEVYIDKATSPIEAVSDTDNVRRSPSASQSNEVVGSGESLVTNQATVSSQELAHLIAPGDSLSLLVYDESDLSVENTRVGSNGEAVFPLIGAIKVSGMTTSQVTDAIVSKLSEGYVRNPRVAVSIASYRPVFVRGEIASGTIPFSEGLTVTKVISLAGGLKSTSRPDGISVIRSGQTIASALNASSEFPILSGDIVDVEADSIAKEAEKAFIYLHGEVNAAGEYLYRPGLTVEKAVVLAGGFTIRASKKKIQITRYLNVEEGGEPEVLNKAKLYEPIKPGDVIKVGASWF